jgi:hypothetical protein
MNSKNRTVPDDGIIVDESHMPVEDYAQLSAEKIEPANRRERRRRDRGLEYVTVSGGTYRMTKKRRRSR